MHVTKTVAYCHLLHLIVHNSRVVSFINQGIKEKEKNTRDNKILSKVRQRFEGITMQTSVNNVVLAAVVTAVVTLKVDEPFRGLLGLGLPLVYHQDAGLVLAQVQGGVTELASVIGVVRTVKRGDRCAIGELYVTSDQKSPLPGFGRGNLAAVF